MQAEPTTRAPSQRERILLLLRERGSTGASNVELNEIGFRYGARLWELKKMGHRIETVREGDTLFRFVWKGYPSTSSGSPLRSDENGPSASLGTSKAGETVKQQNLF